MSRSGARLALLIALGAPHAAAAAPTPAAVDPVDAVLKGPCRSSRGVMLVTSPRRPTPGSPLRIIAVSERPIAGATLLAKTPTGRLKLTALARGGPPYWWFAQLDRPGSGSYRFVLVDAAGQRRGCDRTRVRRPRQEVKPSAESWWKTGDRSWHRRRENLYSAWIEKLFDAPADQRPTWSPLHALLRDPSRNFLHNHLGASEDGPKAKAAVVVKPDCADFPYYLRAYFAWKLRLPFGYRQCSRGSTRRPPRCTELKTNLEPPPTTSGSTPAERFSFFLRRRVSYVHSGAGGTAGDDDQADLYPLALTRSAIRPGTIYVDTAGHLMVVARWFPQQGDRSGQLFVVESQPDLTVGRKRFWRGAMLFTPRPKGAAGGFKAFRPLIAKEGQIVALTNKEIREDRGYRSYSTKQYRIGKDDFYEHVDRLINPKPLSPVSAYRAQLAALFELVQKRKDSVATGETYVKGSGFKRVKMPTGPRIFQTTGPWEDYSTPSRDFRLLIAVDQVLGFPARVTKHPDRFALPAGRTPAQVTRELEALLKRLAPTKKISYIRSDGSLWSLSLAEVMARRKGLEMGYNPNDCIEIRWAAEGKELSTCDRHAPAEQRQRMSTYRGWFATRTRPPLR